MYIMLAMFGSVSGGMLGIQYLVVGLVWPLLL